MEPENEQLPALYGKSYDYYLVNQTNIDQMNEFY